MDDNLQNPRLSEVEENDPEDLELSHTDKLVGVFTEPASTFEKMSQTGPKVSDWIIPLIILIVVASLSNFIMMSNPIIKSEALDKQMEAIDKNFSDAVDKGQMTQEQADQQKEMIRNQMEQGGGMFMIFSVIGIVIFSFIFFFLIALIYFLIGKFGFKDNADYKSTMSAYGLPYYIAALQVIFIVIFAMLNDRIFTGVSVGEFMQSDKSTLAGFILHKLDIFSIWFYAVVSIGLAKMFKASSTVKYYALVFIFWFGGSLIIFFLAQSLPFFKNFIQ